ncbi:hypothetical protein HK100_006262, partial [Physocladia obscura]
MDAKEILLVLRLGRMRAMQATVYVGHNACCSSDWYGTAAHTHLLALLQPLLPLKLARESASAKANHNANSSSSNSKNNADADADAKHDQGDADICRHFDVMQFAYWFAPLPAIHALLTTNNNSDKNDNPFSFSFSALHLHPLMLFVCVQDLRPLKLQTSQPQWSLPAPSLSIQAPISAKINAPASLMKRPIPNPALLNINIKYGKF